MDNPYSATNANLSSTASEGETYQPQFFSIHGRIGRLRYLAYSWLAMFCLSVVGGILAAVLLPLAGKSKAMAVVAMGLVYIPIIAASLIYAKRRLNDLDQSGWLSLLMLVPLLNIVFGLYLMFGPGSSGGNSYGPRPEKNSVLLIVGGMLLPIAMIGILAAVALPAYNDYVKRAKNAAIHQAP